MVMLPQQLGQRLHWGTLRRLQGWIREQEGQGERLLQLGEQLEGDRVVRLKAGRQLIAQPRLALNQSILVAGERLEFLDQGAVRRQASQVVQVTTPRLGQQIGVNRVRLGARGLAQAVHRLGVDGVDGQPRIQHSAVMSRPWVVSMRQANSCRVGAAATVPCKNVTSCASPSGVWATRQEATRWPCSSMTTAS